jgi:hypothetical protein
MDLVISNVIRMDNLSVWGIDMRIEIIGVYAITEANCHLIEVRILDHFGPIEMAEFTQQNSYENVGWQVAWDERILNSAGTKDIGGKFPTEILVNGEARIVFYMHYLDFNMPLKTPIGRLKLPDASLYPKRLAFLRYDPPN